MQAEQAFEHAARARRRAALACRLRHRGARCGSSLPVLDGDGARSRPTGTRSGIRDIPLDSIRGTLEPNRAAQFDPDFRPASPARTRWERVWLAAERGVALPPIAVVPVGDGYAIRDGHHRVSVARARGACSITAIVG